MRYLPMVLKRVIFTFKEDFLWYRPLKMFALKKYIPLLKIVNCEKNIGVPGLILSSRLIMWTIIGGEYTKIRERPELFGNTFLFV